MALRDALVERDELVGEEILAVIHAALAAREPAPRPDLDRPTVVLALPDVDPETVEP
jgi:hypothetical protein